MDIVVIGAGMGGLFCGAFLAKEGHRVTILEKNKLIGGGLQTFIRKGEMYETGMHVAGGFESGGTLDMICRYLGIRDSLELVPTDLMAQVTYLEENKTFSIPSGRRAFTDYLIKLYPHERQHIEAYIEALFRLSKEEKLFYMKSGADSHTHHSEEFLMPANQFIATYIEDSGLRALLAFMNPLYAGVAGHTPAYLHAMISVLFIEQPCRFKGGSSQLATALAGVVEQAGGTVVTDCEVVRIPVADRKIEYVEDATGREFRGDMYISAIHPCLMTDMVEGKAFTPGYKERLRTIPSTVSAFKLYIKVKPYTMPYVDHQLSVLDSMSNAWNMCDYQEEQWPHGLSIFMTPCPDGKWASHITVMSLMKWDEVKLWEDSVTGERPQAYREWKRERSQRLISMVRKVFPNIDDHMEYSFAASPLTFRDYLGSKNGSIYGYYKDSQDLVSSQLPIRTKVHNLLLTGQNVNMHGIGGVPMTAIETAGTIVGLDTIVGKIKKIKTI